MLTLAFSSQLCSAVSSKSSNSVTLLQQRFAWNMPPKRFASHAGDYDPYIFFPTFVNSWGRINITPSEKTARQTEISIWFGFTKRSFQRKTKKRGTRLRHTQASALLCAFVSVSSLATVFVCIARQVEIKLLCCCCLLFWPHSLSADDESPFWRTGKANVERQWQRAWGLWIFLSFQRRALRKRRFIRDQCRRFSFFPCFFLPFPSPISQCTECMENIKVIHQVFRKEKQLLCAKWLSYSSCWDRLILRFITQSLQRHRSPYHK